MTARRHIYKFKDSNTVRIIDSMNELLGKRQVKLMGSSGLLKRKKFSVPVIISGRYKTEAISVKGHRSITIHPDEKQSKTHIVYFHGGAYISQGRIVHWILLSRIVSELGCRATYVDYPLTPEFTYEDTVEMAKKTYIRLTEKYPDDDFMLGGDSAGGGLALVLAQVIEEMKYAIKPSKIVMICPWLDISIDSRRIKRIEKKDFILNRQKLLEFAKQYAGNDNLKNPLVSPLFGSISGLGKMLLVSGTHELIYPDCHELYKKARDEDVDLDFLVYNKMPHVWIFYPIMEARHVFERIIEFLRN